MLKRVIWFFGLLLFLGLLALVSYWLLLFSFLGLVYYLLHRWNADKREWLSPVLAGVTAFILVLLWYLGIIRPTKEIGSCLTGPSSRLTLLIEGKPPSSQVQNPAAAFQIELANRVMANRSRARATLYTDVVTEQATSFLEQNRTDEQSATVVDLRAKLTDLRSFLKSTKEIDLGDPNQRRAAELELEKELDGLIARARSVSNPAAQQQVNDDLSALLNRSPFFDLYLRLKQVQTLQQKLANSDITVTTKPRILVEGNQFVFEEAIDLDAVRGELVEIDASPLVHEALLDKLTYNLRLQQPSGYSVPDNPEHVYVTPGIKHVTLLSQRRLDIGPAQSCTMGYLSSIRHLEIGWPQSYALQLIVVSNVTDFGKIISTVDLHRNAPMSEIDVPLWSYFTDKEELAVRRQEGHDVLDPKQQLGLASFTSTDPFWVEIFKDDFWLRNVLAQRLKEYLIAENALMAVVSGAFGMILSKLAFGKK